MVVKHILKVDLLRFFPSFSLFLFPLHYLTLTYLFFSLISLKFLGKLCFSLSKHSFFTLNHHFLVIQGGRKKEEIYLPFFSSCCRLSCYIKDSSQNGLTILKTVRSFLLLEKYAFSTKTLLLLYSYLSFFSLH